MKRHILTATFLTLMMGQTVHSSQLNDLELLGKGEAYYLKFIKVYNARLYAEPLPGGRNILSGDISKCLQLEYEVAVDREHFVKAADEILQRQFTRQQIAPYATEISQIHSSYTDVKPGDSYDLCYDKKLLETTLYHNDTEVVRIPSKEFASIYFSIWLGDTAPLDENLRDNLLAKSRVAETK